MRFPPSFLDDIRSRITISSVVGRKVAWDRRKSRPAKGDFWGCCPFHGEKTASFHVEDRKGRYYCFGCKVSGDIFTFLVEREGLSFPDAVERLAQEAGLPMPQVSPEAEAREEKRASLYDVMELAAQFFEQELQTKRGIRARAYLEERGLLAEVQREFRLGYALDDRSALRTFLASKNITLDRMIEGGLLVSGDDVPVAYDRFRDRIMFPIRDARGKVIAFGGRALSKDAQAKYLNSPETPLFHKGQVLYNLDKARAAAHETGQVITVEGYMDTIAMFRAGYAQTVAPLGTALTEDQLRLLWRMAPEPVLCFDGDQAGLKAAYRALDLALPMLKPGYSLKFAMLPEGQDPDDLLKSEGPMAIRRVIDASEALSDILWRRALSESDQSTPERRAQFESELRNLVNQIGDETVRRHYGADLRSRLQSLWSNAALPDQGRSRRTAQNERNRSGRGGRVRSWEVRGPASPQLRALASSITASTTHERRERLILLTIINHPQLLDEFFDSFSTLEFSRRPLDSLRQEILEAAALQHALDGTSLRHHLEVKGFGAELTRLETQAKRLNEWFLSAGAASEDARTGLSQMIALHRKHVTLERELNAAEAAFAADPSEEKLAALKEIREELVSETGEEALIEGFGRASGRPMDAIS